MKSRNPTAEHVPKIMLYFRRGVIHNNTLGINPVPILIKKTPDPVFVDAVPTPPHSTKRTKKTIATPLIMYHAIPSGTSQRIIPHKAINFFTIKEKCNMNTLTMPKKLIKFVISPMLTLRQSNFRSGDR
jgi:hypothetical protein